MSGMNNSYGNDPDDIECVSIDIDDEELAAYLLSMGYRLISCVSNWIPHMSLTFEGITLSETIKSYEESPSLRHSPHFEFYLLQARALIEVYEALSDKQLDEFESWKGSHYLWHHERV